MLTNIVLVLVFATLNDAAPRSVAVHNMTSAPNSRVAYSLDTVQKGTVLLPSDRVRMMNNRTKMYFTKTETQSFMHHYPKTSTITNRRTQIVNDSVSCCPAARTLVAQRRLDAVLLSKLPPVLSCASNKPFASKVYELRTLFDIDAKLLLSAGSHSFISQIVNRKSGKEVKTCHLRFHVVIRQCSTYRTYNTDLVATCDRDRIWGSECSFSCGPWGRLSHARPVICNDDLQWIGQEPTCVAHDSNPHNHQRHLPCAMPIASANASIRCEIIDNQIENREDGDNGIADGSRCKVICNSGFMLMPSLRRSAIIQCNNGQWSSSAEHLCQR